jgi:hypothetical protein
MARACPPLRKSLDHNLDQLATKKRRGEAQEFLRDANAATTRAGAVLVASDAPMARLAQSL